MYERTDGRHGKKRRWMTIADEVQARFKAAGRPWDDAYAGENEPPPLRYFPQPATPESPPPDPEPEPTADELIARLRDRKTDPAGEELNHTARRLKCTLSEAMIERDTWRRLKKISGALKASGIE